VIHRSSTVSPAKTVGGQQDSGATRVPRATDSADCSAQLALLVFVAVLGVGLVLFPVFGHSQWFFLDDWDFLADRRATDLGDLLRPHNEHWMTIPILVYRMLFRLCGLRTYVPFQMAWIGALVLGLTHLILADHDGPIERRDWLGLLTGLAVLCSGVAVTMVVVVGFRRSCGEDGARVVPYRATRPRLPRLVAGVRPR
jgi:hypothetical protein